MATVISGRTSTGNLEGVVHDLFHIAIVGANVYAVNANDMRKRFEVVTGSNGKLFIGNLSPGTYELHAYKESAGYADTFYSFFAAENKNSWRWVRVTSEHTTAGVLLEIGPKCALLKLSIRDERGRPISGSLTFTRLDDVKRPYSRGADLSGETEILLPSTRFRLDIQNIGCEVWHSGTMNPRPGENLSVIARLKCSGPVRRR
jgi:hypothetical protein